MKTFENIASLKLATLKEGQFVETGGYYSKGDGGGARYLIVTPQAADEYGDHTLANGNVAVLQVSGALTVREYGATADGVTDDSQSFIAASAASNESVYVPFGNYELNGENLTANKYHSFGAPTFANGTIAVLNLNP